MITWPSETVTALCNIMLLKCPIRPFQIVEPLCWGSGVTGWIPMPLHSCRCCHLVFSCHLVLAPICLNWTGRSWITLGSGVTSRIFVDMSDVWSHNFSTQRPFVSVVTKDVRWAAEHGSCGESDTVKEQYIVRGAELRGGKEEEQKVPGDGRPTFSRRSSFIFVTEGPT